MNTETALFWFMLCVFSAIAHLICDRDASHAKAAGKDRRELFNLVVSLSFLIVSFVSLFPCAYWLFQYTTR